MSTINTSYNDNEVDNHNDSTIAITVNTTLATNGATDDSNTATTRNSAHTTTRRQDYSTIIQNAFTNTITFLGEAQQRNETRTCTATTTKTKTTTKPTTIGLVFQKHLTATEQLQLYGLYKQSTIVTDCSGDSSTTTTTGTDDITRATSAPVASTSSSTSSSSSSSSSSSNSWWSTTTSSNNNSSSSSSNAFSILRNYKKRCAWESVQHLSMTDAQRTYLQCLFQCTQRMVVVTTSTTLQNVDEQAILLSLHNYVKDIIKNLPESDEDEKQQQPRLMNNTSSNEQEKEPGRTSSSVVANSHPKAETTETTSFLHDPNPTNDSNNSTCWYEHVLQQFVPKQIKAIQSRGQLDISYSDLHYTMYQLLWQCFYYWCCISSSNNNVQRQTYESYESDIQSLWKDAIRKQQSDRLPSASTSSFADDDCHVVVGLSVRTLLDLVLQQQQQHTRSSSSSNNKRKEIIISPPITVPGILQIFQYHNIHIVGVDIDQQQQQQQESKQHEQQQEDAETHTTSTTIVDEKDDAGCGGGNVQISINVPGIEEAISSNTIAIMIVHVFGMIVASESDMQQLRNIATNSNILLLEDCAECFTSLSPRLLQLTTTTTSSSTEPGATTISSYLGSPYADISFFSFGFIKTMTSIHGGIAIVWKQQQQRNQEYRKNQVLYESLTRLQQSYRYPHQSNVHFFQQLCKCYFILFVTQSPILYGLIYTILSKVFGAKQFDSIVTSLLRGFPSNTTKQMIQRIRQRPSLAMMALLRRRLRNQTTGMSSFVLRRIQTGQQFTKQIQFEQQEHGTNMKDIRTLTSKPDYTNYYWLYPIFVKDPSAVSHHLRQCGYDATSGASQLCCIPSSTTSEASSPYPVAQQLMSDILYLPTQFTGPKNQLSSSNGLIQALRSFYTSKDIQSSCVTRRYEKAPTIVPSDSISQRNFLVRPVLFGGIVLVLWFSWSYLVTTTIFTMQIVVVLTLIYGTLIWLLRCQMGLFYLQSSHAFGKYSSLLWDRSEKPCKIQSNPNMDINNIISQIESLQIPLNTSDRTAATRSILITGATGFVGNMLLRDLLFYRHELKIGCIIVLCRSRKGKSAATRVQTLLNDCMFSFLTEQQKKELVLVIDGDISLPRAGLTDECIDSLQLKGNVTHIINCAASTSFTQSLSEAATSNIMSSLNVQSLASIISSERIQFVHISTAFVHGANYGANGDPLLEELSSLGPFDPVKIYESMCGTQFYASKAMSELSFPNTYTFSKCVSEHLLLMKDPTSIIIRPSIIGPAIQFPSEGWAGRTPSTLVAAACLYLSYQWNIWSFGRHRVPIIPVDVVSRFIIGKSFRSNQFDCRECSSLEETSSDGSYDIVSSRSLHKLSSSVSSSDSEKRHQIFNATWDVQSPDSACFTWFDYAGAVTQVGSVVGYFDRATAYLGLMVATRWVPKAKLSGRQFKYLHDCCVKYPFECVIKMIRALGMDTSRMNRLHSFLDLPSLFYPFMNNTFYFHSELIAPTQLDGERYLMCCVASSHKFVQKSMRSNKPDCVQDADELAYFSLLSRSGANRKPCSRSIFWAISQPSGNFGVRIIGWILIHILRKCFTDITFDTQLFASRLHTQRGNDRRVLVLAPTHRSIFDSVILTVICFAIPELQMGLPSIAAADTFERLPFIGWTLRYLGAFYVRRGRMTVDPHLTDTISAIKTKSSNSEIVVELFVEGTRSRDRRFGEPKTGVLRCLYDPHCQQMIVPITINYEGIAEQRSLVNEASGGLASGLHMSVMISWLANVFLGRIKLGRVHISAAEPILLGDEIEPDWTKTVGEIQIRQANEIRVSEYHVNASSSVLSLDCDTVRRAFVLIGVKFFPEPFEPSLPDPPSTDSEKFSTLLQVSSYLAPLIISSHKKWSKWLWDPVEIISPFNEETLNNPDVQKLSKAIIALFDQADAYIGTAIKTLEGNGFVRPRSRHIRETAIRNHKDFPVLLLQASTELRRKSNRSTTTTEASHLSSAPRTNVGTNETLGYWGFRDSQFILDVDSNGRSFVRMDGNHYNLRNEKISSLLSFIEAETGMKIDPLNEAFATASDKWNINPSAIQGSDLEVLKQVVSIIYDTDEERLRHGTGHSQNDIILIRSKGELRVPDIVVKPACEEEVQAVVHLSQKHKWCVIPFGGGTNVTNALRCPSLDIEPRPIISMDMRDMCRILWIDEENGVAHVEAGITGRQLEDELDARGHTMGHEPDSIEFSTLGGWIATKASGMKRNKYGNIEDIIKAVRVIGPNGMLRHGPETSQFAWGRESCGIDLCNLVLGTEGCMGIITSAIVRIWPVVETKDYDCILFPCFNTGLRFVREISKLGPNLPASVRLLDNEHFRLGLALRPDPHSVLTSFVNWCYGIYLKSYCNYDPLAMVSVTFMYEGSAAEVKRQKQAVNQVCLHYGGLHLGSKAGKAGYELTFMIAYIRDFALTYHFLGESFETFSPWSQIDRIITETKAAIYKEHAKRYLPGKPFVGCRVTQLYHEGACLYFYFCMNIVGVDNASLVYSDIEHVARSVILANGGSLSHHHGIGKARTSYLKEMDSDPFLQTIKTIKHNFDPDNIFGGRNGAFLD